MRTEIPLTWGPSVEISKAVREAGQPEEAPHRERRRHLTFEQWEECGADPPVSGREGVLTEREQPIGY